MINRRPPSNLPSLLSRKAWRKSSKKVAYPAETVAAFSSIEDWRSFISSTDWVFSKPWIRSIVESARQHGLLSHFLGHRSAEAVSIVGENWRETISVDGCSSRGRAMLDLVHHHMGENGDRRLLMLEAITPFALMVRGRYAFALGTEYLPTPETVAAFFPVPHCDIQSPPFAEESFDLIVSNDVMEHVPDPRAGLCGMAKLLKSGGTMLATFPFAYMHLESDVRASIQDGKIQYSKDPEYHGNPVDPAGQSLVFTVMGWEVLDWCLDAGFRTAEIVFVSSHERAITGTEVAGVFVLRAVR